MGRPQSRCSGLGRSERIRVPSPAASTTADSCDSSGMPLFYQRRAGICASLVGPRVPVAGSSMAERRPLEPYVGGSSPPPPAPRPPIVATRGAAGEGWAGEGWVGEGWVGEGWGGEGWEGEVSPAGDHGRMTDITGLGRSIVVGPGQPAPADW